jgi:hypothetical protein
MNVNCDSGFQGPSDGMLIEMEWAVLLEEYLAWLATQYEGPGFHLISHHFDLSGYRMQLRDHVSSGRLAESQALHSYFVAALLRARKLRQVIVDNNIVSAKIRCFWAHLSGRETTDNIQPGDLDENELTCAIIGKHDEKWRLLSSQVA